MNEPLNILLKFAAGEMSAKEFENELFSNSELMKLLSDSSLNWSGTYIVTNLYDYLMTLNYCRPEGRTRAIEALVLFFKKKNIEFTKFKEREQLINLAHLLQPKYLDVEMRFIEKNILPKDSELLTNDISEAIEKNFNKYFKYQNSPPKWLQGPNWLIKNDKPLFFIGQLELKKCDVFQEDGFVYVFFNIDTGKIETLKQFYANKLVFN